MFPASRSPHPSHRRALALTFLLVSVGPMVATGQARSPETNEGSAGASLRIVPPSMVASGEHPARFTVLLVGADGTVRDVTRADDLELRFDVPEVAAVAGDQMIRANQVGTAELTAGWNGLTATAQVDVARVAPQRPNFPVDVSAVLSKAGCNLGTCHGSLHGKAGFRLSLRGDDPAFDFRSVVRSQAGRRIDWLQPDQSLLLRKPSGRVAHRGGLRLPADSDDYQTVLRWLQAGGRWTSEHAAPTIDPTDLSSPRPPRVRALTVWPQEALVDPAATSMPLVVVAEMADGETRDVTRLARYESSVVSGVTISETGEVHADQPIDVAVSVSFLDARTQSRLVFLERSKTGAVERPAERSPIDRLVGRRLEAMRIPAAEPASPAVFLRRLLLTATGRLPTAAEAREFLADRRPDRRSRWIDRALADRGYADLWALHWSDLLRNEQKVMSDAGAARWNAWLAEQFRADRPLNEMVHELVSSVGSTYDNPPASFHRTHRDPAVAAEAVGQVFLGVRIACARCHNHPFDVWKQDDYYGLASYFTTVRRKAIDNQPGDKLDKHIITGDEVISLAGKPPRIRHPGRSVEVPPEAAR